MKAFIIDRTLFFIINFLYGKNKHNHKSLSVLNKTYFYKRNLLILKEYNLFLVTYLNVSLISLAYVYNIYFNRGTGVIPFTYHLKSNVPSLIGLFNLCMPFKNWSFRVEMSISCEFTNLFDVKYFAFDQIKKICLFCILFFIFTKYKSQYDWIKIT